MDRHALQWPFLDDRHRALGLAVERWAQDHLKHSEFVHGSDDPNDLDAVVRALVAKLGEAGLLNWVVPNEGEKFDLRAICVAREILARYSGIAESAFGVQGLGSAAITEFASQTQKERFLTPIRTGRQVAAFALSEPDAGSDVANMTTSARSEAEGWVLNGTKTWISNGGVADLYTVFARTGEHGANGISAFIVPAGTRGFHVIRRLKTMAAHPLATLFFEDCRIDGSQLIGRPGDGFKIAMATLDLFRTSVGAAALGFARCAFEEALAHIERRQVFGAKLADQQMSQAKIADMATLIDTAALAVYRAAWTRDVTGRSPTATASMAKMHASEAAQRVIDDAVQLFGGLGVKTGSAVEALYREIRSVRIYDGATEIQKLIIARHARAAYRDLAACQTG